MIRRCYWGFTWHPAETAVRFGGGYPKPACYRHRANVELMRLESRKLFRDFDRAMTRILDAINTPLEQVDEWARQIRAKV